MIARLLLFVAALPLMALYSYFLTDSFGSVNSAVWQANGTISGSGSGLISGDSNGGSVIYKSAISDGVSGTDVAYEVRATFKIVASGGTFVLYSHASMDALSGPGTAGSFYAAELTPTLTTGGCRMAANSYKRVGGTVTLLAAQPMACADGMTVRLGQRSGYFVLTSSLGEVYFVGDASLASGRPGFGARGLPSGNGISEGRLAGAEYVAPGTIVSSSVRTALFDTRVDLAWAGVVDDVTSGSGLLMYQVQRNGAFMGNVRGGYISDTTVLPGTTYTYSPVAYDLYLNYSITNVTVTTPAAGTRDARKVGVRRLGSYWGATPGRETARARRGRVRITIDATITITYL